MKFSPFQPIGFAAFVFSCKAALAATLAYVSFLAFHLPGAAWAPVSAVIVMQPALHPSIQAVMFRVMANLIGALVGATLATLWGPTIPVMAVGVLLTGLACHWTKLEESMRPANVAVVIVVLTKDSSVWFGSLDRLLAVVIGCASAILVSVLFDKFLYRFMVKVKNQAPARPSHE